MYVENSHGYKPAGGVSTGGGIHVGGAFTSPKGMYHQLLRTNPYEWEMIREAAAQHRGYTPNPMWPVMTDKNMVRDSDNYDRIVNSHSPSLAAKHLFRESQTAPSGGAFYDSLKHTLRSAAHGYNKLSKWSDPWVNDERLQQYMPFLRDASQFKSNTDPFFQDVEAQLSRGRKRPRPIELQPNSQNNTFIGASSSGLGNTL
jgi:hypothetical protein